MGTQRNILFIALAFVSFLLFQQWQLYKNPPVAMNATQTQDSIATSELADQPLDPIANTASSVAKKLITVTTDVLNIHIDTYGGDIVFAELNNYADELDSEQRFVLLEQSDSYTFIAQSGLIGEQGIDLSNNSRPAYTIKDNLYTLADGEDEVRIPLTYTANGLEYTKTFILKRSSYAIDVQYDVVNNSGNNATFGMYARLRQTLTDSGGSLTMPTYKGGAYSSEDNNYKKYDFDDMKDRNLSINLPNGQGWAAMIQHYFATAWIPDGQADTSIYSRVYSNTGDIGIRIPNTTIANGDSASMKATLWVGPKLQDQMAVVAPHLDLVVDYGWLWFIAKPLHWLLSLIQGIVVNWGIAIMVLTFIVRGAMYPLTKAQYTSMAKMRMLQPKLQEMRERIGDDRQRMSQEMMELYKKEKVNPLGGCLPLILQMPIFIALYWTLMESVELRHSPFFGWITDLSAQDPYFILPLLMGASMFMIQKMSPTTVTDPMQQKIMTFMPVMFTFFFLFFPSGLVLYWLVSNIVTLIQQTLIYKSLEKKGLHSR